MNNLFIKTAEACSQVYVGKNGVNPNIKREFRWESLIISRYRDECMTGPATISSFVYTFSASVIIGFLFFFIIKKRKNMQKTFAKIITLLGIILLGIIFMWTIVMNIGFIVNL